jgi:hypothetical protein
MSTLAMDAGTRFRRAKSWLQEPPGELFHKGKWYFWMPALATLSILNTILNVHIFGEIGKLYWFIGLMLFWLSIGALHYSDVPNRFLAVLISVCDGVILVSLAASFVLLFYIYRHADILRAEEVKFEQYKREDDAAALKALDATARIAEANARAEEARNSSIRSYQDRDQLWSASRMSRTPGGAVTAPKLEIKQREFKGERVADYLARWEMPAILLTGFEVFMTILTLFIIRIGTAWINQKVQAGNVQAVARRTPSAAMSKPVAMSKPADVLDIQKVEPGLGHRLGHSQAVPLGQIRSRPLGHLKPARLGHRNVQKKIKFDFVAPGVWASPDRRTKDRWNVNRTRKGIGTKYLCRISGAELDELRRSPPAWGLEFIRRKIEEERRNDAKKQQAIEFLEAA